ncbi:uncharacterized protein LOC133830872 [Humulus lupulus]|uniref:uncharacterized protein LOC133830872 n=1 Tax=Humulus lupulus TaxID=3486 RepID=UPI002B411624|nr:uncharacterized protein LOC133830872 [Humulus lupulus]
MAKVEVKERRDKDSAESEGEVPTVLPSSTDAEGLQVNNSEGIQLKASANIDEAKGANDSKQWHTPKRVATQSKQGLVADLCSRNKIGVGGFLETKMKGNKIMEFMEHKLPNWEFYSSSVTEGRLLIVWRKVFVRVTLLEESNQYVHCLVKMAGQRHALYVTFVYGLNTIEGRRSLWKGLQRISLSVKAWIILGDFNVPFSDHHDFKEVVMNSWRIPIKATGLRAIYLKTMRLKHRLKKFNRDNIGDIGLNYHKAKETYQEAQLQAQSHPRDYSFQEVVKVAAEDFTVQEHMYHNFLAQRSKITWLRKGDMNTSFLHACLKKHRDENGIATYITDQGRLIDNFHDVVFHFVEHFRSYLGVRVLLQTRLIYTVLRWDIGDEVCSIIGQCFDTGSFPSELHETTLSLVPKVANPSRAIDYRPIACCSTLYKCIAKLLCSRMALVLPDLIQPIQGAFIWGHSIAHNIMMFQDLTKNYGRTSTLPRCAIKIVLSKAYDTIDWKFLEDLLRALCFLMKFIGWIMVCLKNTSYSFLMNGRVQGRFKGKKGLRQGDPMSPLLFELVSAVSIFKEVLVEFSAATGLSINANKSHVFFGGVTATERRNIAQEIQLPEGSFPLKYLGVSMRPTKWRHEDCDIILQKIRLRLLSWTSRHL